MSVYFQGNALRPCNLDGLVLSLIQTNSFKAHCMVVTKDALSSHYAAIRRNLSINAVQSCIATIPYLLSMCTCPMQTIKTSPKFRSCVNYLCMVLCKLSRQFMTMFKARDIQQAAHTSDGGEQSLPSEFCLEGWQKFVGIIDQEAC